MLIQAKNLSLSYQDGTQSLQIIDQLNLSLPAAGLFGILGPSGSGKTSLLYLLSGMRKPTNGEVLFEGKPLPSSANGRQMLRRRKMGFIFQMHFLINYLTVIENILIGVYEGEFSQDYLEQLLEFLGLHDLTHRYPYQLSGGQRQRVAIARALANHPKVIFADEPTASLDKTKASQLMSLLHQISQRSLIVMVTHDQAMLASAQGVLYLEGGKLYSTHRSQSGTEIHSSFAGTSKVSNRGQASEYNRSTFEQVENRGIMFSNKPQNLRQQF